MSTSTKTIAIGLVLSMVLAGGLVVVGCDDSSGAVKETPVSPTPDAAARPASDGGGPGTDGSSAADSGPSDCVQNPHTHDEIINACTDAVKITKSPSLPLLLPDGGLPPLP